MIFVSFGAMAQTSVSEIPQEQSEVREALLDSIDHIDFVEINPYWMIEVVKNDKANRYDTIPIESYQKTAIKKNYTEGDFENALEKDRFFNQQRISPADVDSIFSLLYASKINDQARKSIKCYNPRHGLLLYSGSGLLLGFIEICFECEKIKVVNTTLAVDFLPTSSYEALKKILSKY